MDQNNLDHYFKQVKETPIDFQAIERKRQHLMHHSQPIYISPKFSIITALALLATVSILGSVRLQQVKQQSIAQMRDQVFDYDFMHDTYVTAFSSDGVGGK